MRSRLPDGGRMSSGSVVYSRWVQARCRHSLNSFAEGPACRCWVRNWVPDSTMPFVALGPRSNDPLRCGLNSAHPTFAMRNLLQFAKSLRGCTMLPCFCIARTFYPADSVPPAFLWPGATVGWVGAPKFFAGFRFREAAFAARCAQGCLTVVA